MRIEGQSGWIFGLEEVFDFIVIGDGEERLLHRRCEDAGVKAHSNDALCVRKKCPEFVEIFW